MLREHQGASAPASGPGLHQEKNPRSRGPAPGPPRRAHPGDDLIWETDLLGEGHAGLDGRESLAAVQIGSVHDMTGSPQFVREGVESGRLPKRVVKQQNLGPQENSRAGRDRLAVPPDGNGSGMHGALVPTLHVEPAARRRALATWDELVRRLLVPRQ